VVTYEIGLAINVQGVGGASFSIESGAVFGDGLNTSKILVGYLGKTAPQLFGF